jgi:hypothetical protein
VVCREKYRKANGEGPDGVTVLVVCPDVDSAREEAARIGKEQRRPVYNRTFKDKGKPVARFTVYRDEQTTNVVVES